MERKVDKYDLLEVKLEALTKELENFRRTMIGIYVTIVAPIVVLYISGRMK